MKLSVREMDYFLPYQVDWILDDSPMKLSEKSRRVGYTYSTSYRSNRKCLSRPPDFIQYVSSRDLPTAKDFVAVYVAKWAKMANAIATGLMGENEIIVDPEKGIRAFVVKYAHGPQIISLSSTPEAFAGKGGDVLLDEVDLHPDPGTLLDMATPCTIMGGQVEAVSAYKPDGSPDSVFAKVCQDAKGANPMDWSFHRTTLLDAIDQGYVEKVNEITGRKQTREEFIASCRAKCRTEAAWRSQYLCEPSDEGGTLLSYELIGLNESPEASLDYDYEKLKRCAGDLYLGMDIGRRHDLGMIWLDELLGDVSVTRVVRVFDRRPFREMREALYSFLELPSMRRACIDESGLGMQLAEEAKERFGYLVEPLTLSGPVKEVLAMQALRYFQDRKTRNPASEPIREAFHKIKKTVTPAGNVRFDGDRDDAGHVDEFWARALALNARLKPQDIAAPVVFTPAMLGREEGSFVA